MADTEKLGVKVFLQPDIEPKEWSADKLQQLIGEKKVTIKVSKLEPTPQALSKLRQAIESGLSGVNLDLKLGKSGNDLGSVSKGAKEVQASLAAAQKMANSFSSTFSGMLTTTRKTTGSVDSLTAPLKNLTNAYDDLKYSISQANKVEGQDAIGFINQVEGAANAYQQAENYAGKYAESVKTLTTAQQTYNTALANGFGGTESAKALSTQIDSLSKVIEQVQVDADGLGHGLYQSMNVGIDGVKQAQSAFTKASKSMTTDMSGVQKTMQDIGNLMSSGGITDQKQIDALNSFNDQLRAMQQAGVADTKALDSMNKELVKMTSADNGSTKEISADLKAAQEATEAFAKTYDTTIAKMGKAGEYTQNIGPMQEYTQAHQNLVKVMNEAAQSSKTAQEYLGKVSSASEQFSKSSQHINQYNDAMKQLKTTQQEYNKAEMKGLGDTQEAKAMVTSMNELQDATNAVATAGANAGQDLYDSMAKATLGANETTAAWKKASKDMTTDMSQVHEMIDQVNQLLASGNVTDQNQVATLTRFVSQLTDIQKSGVASTKTLNSMQKQINNIAKSAQPATSALKGMVTQFKNMATSMLQSMVIRQVFSTIQKGIKQVISTVKELDSAMTQLEIVTGASATELSQYFDAAAESAKTYGASITDIVGSMETFARLGYNLQDSLNLTNTATLMSNVAATSVDEATTGLTSIVKAYGIEASEASNVADELIAVGQSYAISAEELMTAFEKGGAALAAANNSIEESIALFAAANASVQNANNVGTALRTTSARIRSATAELDEMGEEYDELVESTADYRAEIMALSGVDIMASEDQFKSTYNILRQIAEVWDDISDVSQAALLEDLAGKRNANVIMSVINNLQDLEGAYETANNAAGTATEANDIYMQSIEGRTAQLSATAEEFTEALNIQGLIKGVITSAQELLDVITKFTNAIGGLPGLIGAVGVAITGLQMEKAAKQAGSLTKAFQNMAKGIQGSMSAITVGAAAVSAAMLAIGVAVSAYQSYQQKWQDLRQGVVDSAEAYNEASLDINSYADEVAELKGKLESTNISEQQAYEVRQRLVEIQDTLNDAYGDEAGNLDLVSGSADDAAAALRQYNKVLAESYVYDSENVQAYNKAVDKLTNTLSGDSAIAGAYTDFTDLDQLNQILDAYETLSTYTDSFGLVHLTTEGTAEQVESDILELSQWLDTHQLKLGFDQQYLQDALNEQLGNVRQTIDTWQETRDSYLQMQVVVDAEASDIMDQITGVAEAAQDALLSGDYSNLDFTLFDTQSIQDQIDGLDDAEIAKYLQDKLDEVISELGPVQLTFDVASSTSDIQRILTSLDYIFGATGQNQILNLQFGTGSQVAAFDKLNEAAQSYGMTVEQLLDELVQLGVVTDDSLEYSLMDLQDARDAVQATADSVLQGYNRISSFQFADTGTPINYTTSALEQGYLVMQDYSNQLYELQEYMLKSNAGKATARDFQNLTNTFPQLIGQTDNARFAVENLYNSIRSDSIQYLQDMLDDVDSDQARKELLDFEDQFLELCDVVQYTEFKVDIDAETDSLANLVTAINESNSATGVSQQSVANLTDRYKDLDSFDPQALFERTSNGVKLNTQETQRLEAALKEQNHQLAQSNLEYWQGEYYRVAAAIENASTQEERLNLYAERDTILQKIEDTANLATRYEALTSTYNEYQTALSTTNEHDMYDNIIAGYDDVEDMLARGWVTDEVRAYIDMFTSEDLGTASVLEVAEAWQHLGDTIEGTTYSALDFFTYDDNGNSTAQGVANFYDAVTQVQQGLDQVWAYTDENGQMVLNLGINGQQQLADALGVDIDLVEILIRSMSEAGDFDVHISNWTDQYTRLGKEIYSCQSYVQQLLDMGDYNINLDVDSTDLKDVQSQIEAVSQLFKDEFTDAQGNIDINDEGVQATLSVLERLYMQQELINNPMILSLNTEQIDGQASDVIQTLQGVIITASEMEASISAGVDTSWAISDVQELISQIQGMDAEIWTELGLSEGQIDDLVAIIQDTNPEVQVTPQMQEQAVIDLKDAIEGIQPSVLAEVIGDDSQLLEFMEDTESGEYDVEPNATYHVIDREVVEWMGQNHDTDSTTWYDAEKDAYFDSNLKAWKNQSGTITYHAVYETVSGGSSTSSRSGYGSAYGTARAEGTAFAEGDWSAGNAGVALVGELGPEMVVTISQPRRLVTSGIINLFNCWDTLKVIKLQRRNEISPSANVTKVEKINHMRYGASLSLV